MDFFGFGGKSHRDRFHPTRSVLPEDLEELVLSLRWINLSWKLRSSQSVREEAIHGVSQSRYIGRFVEHFLPEDYLRCLEGIVIPALYELREKIRRDIRVHEELHNLLDEYCGLGDLSYSYKKEVDALKAVTPSSNLCPM